MRTFFRPVLPLLAASAVLMAAAPAPDARVTLLDAMASELTRNQQQLKMQSHEPPYFMSYQLKDYAQYAVGARYGALFLDDGYRERKLYVDVRVGSYEFDSSVPEASSSASPPRAPATSPARKGRWMTRRWRCAPRCGSSPTRSTSRPSSNI